MIKNLQCLLGSGPSCYRMPRETTAQNEDQQVRPEVDTENEGSSTTSEEWELVDAAACQDEIQGSEQSLPSDDSSDEGDED